MNYEFDGRLIEATDAGYLVDPDEWSRELAESYRSARAHRTDPASLGSDRVSS